MYDYYEFDVSYDHVDGKHRVMLDTGEEVVYLDRQNIVDMLSAIDAAEGTEDGTYA